jgi:hypothetical protein
MTYRSYLLYTLIHYCTFQYLNKNSFIMSSKYGNLFMVLFFKILYCLFIEVISEGSCFELEKLVFEMKHTCTL